MKRTSVAVALGLSLFAAGCPAEKPPAPKAPSSDTNLGTPEAGSSTKKGKPVAPPAEKPATPPAETAPPAPAATPPAGDTAAPAAEAPKKD